MRGVLELSGASLKGIVLEEREGVTMDDLRGTGDHRADAPRRAAAVAWAGYAACAWAFVFAGMGFYWASGGTAGGDTIGPAITKPVAAGAPGWIALLWDPWWLMGGILLGIAAWGYQRRSCLFA